MVDEEELLGVVTTADMQRVAESLRQTTIVGEVMSKKIFNIGPDEEATQP